MIKSIDFPLKEFSTKEELFAELKSNKDDLINLKKANLKNSDEFFFNNVIKESTIKSIDFEDEYIYSVINTTKIMDSHNDVHLDGIWNKSIKEQAGKIYYVADHKLELCSVIAYPKDVEMQLENIDFKELGIETNGTTQALIFKVKKDKIRLNAFKDIINENIQVQHSIRMKYDKMFLCIDSDSKEYKEEKTNWNNYIENVVNKERAEEVGYFWAVTEAQIFKEGSFVTGGGSNHVTPLMQKSEIKQANKSNFYFTI